MRIIAGKLKGRFIKVPSSRLVRPTTDKVKESLFNYLSNQIDFNGMRVCDLYAGSGSLGLETLSRGALEVHFVEKNYPVVKVLSDNIKSLGVEKNCRIFKMDALRFSKKGEHEEYDLILADPPFFNHDIYKVLDNALNRNYITADGRIIIERSVQTREEDIKNLNVQPIKKMGDSLIYEISPA